MSLGPRAAPVALPATVLFSVLFASLLLAGGAGAIGSTGPQLGELGQQEAPQDPMELENNTIVVEVDPDGDARWIVTWTFSVPENGVDQFLTLADEFESGDATVLTLDTFRNVSQQLDAEHDRSIRITNETRTSSPEQRVRNGTGQLTLAFTWENFARVDGDRLYVDDVLATEAHGTWLPGLTADQKLIVRVPPRHGVIDANVDVQNGALRWDGPATFNRSTLQITFIGNRGDPTTPDGPDESNDDANLLLMGVIGFVVVVIAVVLAYLGGRHRDRLTSWLPIGTDEESPAVGETGESAAGGTTDPVSEERAEETSAGTAAKESSSAEIDKELLSDEERVERLLEENGGRMKQADIVEETGWSNAKVSQLLSSMEEEGRIDKLRIGRENLISFPDVDVTSIESDS